jgi:hypothetical protein
MFERLLAIEYGAATSVDIACRGVFAYLPQAAASLGEVVDPERDSGCRIDETAFLEYALAFVKSLFPGAGRPHEG